MGFAATRRQHNGDARSGDGTQPGVQDEASIHSRLVSHSPCAPSVDDFPVHSICALAGAV